MRKVLFTFALSMMMLTGHAQFLTLGGTNHHENETVDAERDEKGRLTTHLNCPDNNHPHMVDLNLPSGTLWACCNIGAHAPEEYGDYFAWGETEVKNVYNNETYQYYNHARGFEDLGSDISSVKKGGLASGTIHHDVAHFKWDGLWHMPTEEKYKELINYCSFTWTSVNGVYGGLFTGRNGEKIFFPAAGAHWDNYAFGQGDTGSYWSSNSFKRDDALILRFNYAQADWSNYSNRCFGLTVRAVVH